ncbi:16455_t:CDS:2, partial [Funneliformis mosseae]
ALFSLHKMNESILQQNPFRNVFDEMNLDCDDDGILFPQIGKSNNVTAMNLDTMTVKIAWYERKIPRYKKLLKENLPKCILQHESM